MKNKYEILFIIKSGTTEAAREKEITKYENIIEKAGGTIDLVDKWGNRRLAYPIDFKRDGYFVLIYFTAPATVPAELERVMRISDAVARFMVVNRNHLGEPVARKKNTPTTDATATAPKTETKETTATTTTEQPVVAETVESK